MFIDTHAHLTSTQFDADRDDVIRRALDAGVRYVVNPAVDLDDSKRAIELAEKHAGVFACVGFHPHEALRAEESVLRDVEDLSDHQKVVAIGEIGLDFYYDFAPRPVQERVFRDQLLIARSRNLPVVIHTRDSLEETVAIVEEAIARHPDWRRGVSGRPAPRGVFHCFSGDPVMARRVINMGFYISFPGMVTFKNAGMARDVAGSVSLDELLLETDSPYLAPVPMRGKRNEPMNVPLIAAKIADLQHRSVEDVARQTCYNSFDLFEVGEPEPDEAA